ncbi:MAG: T9SS type A sorting domain-containing protein, partial [Bacteroidota bacterium]
YLFTPDGQAVANPFPNLPAPLSRPSVTDDGNVFVYISQDNRMNAVTFDWANSTFDHQVIQNEQIWRNVAISRDGNHLAAVTTDNDNRLYVTDSQGDFSFYELFNPTTGDDGQKTGDVLYADVLEWDLTGEWVMYDALNSLNTVGGDDIEYWDISFISVWNNVLNDYSDGYTGKLFNGLPENVSVGNPTFAKNSDYIIAFDYFDEFEDEYFLLATNFETGDVGTIFQNSDLSWPNYSVDDNRMVFDAFDNQNNPVLAFISIGNDKISAVGNASIFLDGGRSGVWFANGERVLLDDKEASSGQLFQAYPNPAGDWLTLDFASEKAGGGQVQVLDLLGKLMHSEGFDVQQGQNRRQVSLTELPAGNYLVRLSAGENAGAVKVVRK